MCNNVYNLAQRNVALDCESCRDASKLRHLRDLFRDPGDPCLYRDPCKRVAL